MKLRGFLKRFDKNESGFAAVIFGLLALPLVVIAGAAVDYHNIGHEYAAIRSAAEAAAIAGAKTQFAADAGSSEDVSVLIPAIFNANYPNAESKVSNVVVDYLADDGDQVMSVAVTADAKTNLLQIIGFPTIPISITAKAAAVFSDKDVEIHFVFDLSSSMGAPDDGSAPPTTKDGPNGADDGCFFMCHDDGSTMRDAGVTPKMDRVFMSFGDASTGFVKEVGDAAENSPVPAIVSFAIHYFDHTFHPEMYGLADRDTTITEFGFTLSNYALGMDGVDGGTDLNTSLSELHTYLTTTSPMPGNTRRIIIIVSDGMHARAPAPFDPAVCTTLKSSGDVYTLFIKMPESVYRNPNLTYVVPGGPSSGMAAIDTWDWPAILNGDNGITSPYGYYSGLNNAEGLMRDCATKAGWAYQGETGDEIDSAIKSMASVIKAPTIRIIN